MRYNPLKKHSRTLVIVLVLMICLLSLSACAKDTTAPVIKSVSLVDNIVTIEATDNKKVTGYKSTINNVVPTVSSEGWQTSNVFTFTDDGSYYVWVKDAVGNITGYSEAVVVNTLAERFDHLNWLTPATGTRTVDGVTYNLADLKAKYGDLYRLVEPLSDAEIESRFAYIAAFYDLQGKVYNETGKTDWFENGLKKTQNLNDQVGDFKMKMYESVGTIKDSTFLPLKAYYTYSLVASMYSIHWPSSFNSKTGFWGVGTDIIDKVSFAEKNFYVRYFMATYEATLKLYNDLGLEPDYVIKDWDGFTK